MDDTKIIELRGEIDGITVFGRASEQGWSFRTLWEPVLSAWEDSPDDPKAPDPVWSQEVRDLEAALPPNWFRLLPVRMAPEFAPYFQTRYEEERLGHQLPPYEVWTRAVRAG